LSKIGNFEIRQKYIQNMQFDIRTERPSSNQLAKNPPHVHSTCDAHVHTHVHIMKKMKSL